MACADPEEEKRKVTNTGSLNRTVLEFNQKIMEKTNSYQTMSPSMRLWFESLTLGTAHASASSPDDEGDVIRL
jgi:hypothetical protein